MTRRIWVPLAVLAALLAMGALASWAIWRFSQPALHERILAEARKRGFELEMEDFSVDPDRVVLRNATVRPIGVRGLAARADTVTLSLSGLTWRSLFGGSEAVTLTDVDVEGADVHVLGSAPSLALELSRWSEQYPAAYDLPARARSVALAWRDGPEQAPWLLIAQGEVTREGGGGKFHAESASLLGRRIGPVGSSWSKADGRIVMGFGQVDPAEAPVHLEILLDAPEPLARIELRRTPLDALTGALGITLPLDAQAQQKTEVEAKAEIELPPSLAPSVVKGTLDLALIGFIPPHPVELQGFLFGDRTTFQTRFEVSADQTTVQLTDTRVAAGAFVLKGDGVVRRTGSHAEVLLRLSESLPCSALAGAAAESRLGKHWASLTKQVLQKFLQGSVQVMVRVEADTRDLGAARITRHIGLGCGLEPLRAPTREELEAFSKQLPGLIAELPKLPTPNVPVGKLPNDKLTPPPLPTGLPALPSALPALPSSLPSLPTQLPELPKLPVAPTDTPAEQEP